MKLPLAILIALTLANSALAQPPNERGEGRRPSNAVLSAIDANGDHEITTDEMKNAFAALKKLDADGDGKLGREEIHPEMTERGGGGGPSLGEPRGAGPDRPDRERGVGRANLVERLRGFDKNKDGKLSKDEIPDRMQQVVARFDDNKDGELDKEELGEMTERLSAAGLEQSGDGESGRGGFGGGPGGQGQRGPGGRGGGPPTAEQVVSDAMSFDANKDGMLSKAELQEFAEEHARRGPPGGGPGFGGRDGGPGGGGDRPQRPARPE